MARQARSKDHYGIFHIHQKCGSSRCIFQNDMDRSYFITILSRAQKKFEFQLFAYCLLSPDEYHLILGVDGGDISKIMKSINISYAMYVRSQGKLFKDRYKSQLIGNEAELKYLVDSIHQRSVPGTSFNSYCTFDPEQINHNENNEFVFRLSIQDFSNAYSSTLPLYNSTESISSNHQQRKCFCKNCLTNYQDAYKRLCEIALQEGVTIETICKDKPLRNCLLQDFRRNSTLSLKELGKLFGGITESSVSKILNDR